MYNFSTALQLLVLLFLGVVVVFIYTTISFVFLQPYFDQAQGLFCRSMRHCFVTVLRVGLLETLGLVSFIRIHFNACVMYCVCLFRKCSSWGQLPLEEIVLTTCIKLHTVLWGIELRRVQVWCRVYYKRWLLVLCCLLWPNIPFLCMQTKSFSTNLSSYFAITYIVSKPERQIVRILGQMVMESIRIHMILCSQEYNQKLSYSLSQIRHLEYL